MIYLIGGRGRLGRALVNEYSNDKLTILDRKIYEDWFVNGSSDKVARYFVNKSLESGCVLIASGLLDPKLSEEDLTRINFHFPKNIIEGATKHGLKVVTFGSIMEDLLQSKNYYIRSKELLKNFIETKASVNFKTIHLKIHTLYGLGEPSPFMFLGQISKALRQNTNFYMTQGTQLREYHHVADESKAIRNIVEQLPFGVLDVSHGQPISLRDIATGVFDSFNKAELLNIGAIENPPQENYDKIFHRPEVIKNINFRDSLPNIIKYMREIII